MKNLILGALACGLVSTARGAHFDIAYFDNAMKASRAGDFATALAELRPFAEQGDKTNQYMVGEFHTFRNLYTIATKR